MGVSWLSSVTLDSLEAHHFERTVAYLAWETRPNSLYSEKSKNKILMPEFLAIIQSTRWIQEGRAGTQHTTEWHCSVFTLRVSLLFSEDLIYHLLLGELTSPGGLLCVLQKFLWVLSLGFCYPSLGLLAREPAKANACPVECAHNPCHLYPKLWLKGSVNFLINVFFMPSSAFIFPIFFLFYFLIFFDEA